MPANHELWQVEVGGQVYEADLSELAAWVADGALQPEDKVRKGNLRWIEARRVPNLVPHFNAKRDGTPPPTIVVTVTDASTEPALQIVNDLSPVSEREVAKTATAVNGNPDFCSLHPDIPTVFICKACERPYCKVCPSSYGGSVKICPSCGGLCEPKDQIKATKQLDATFQQALDQGFGLGDLGAAIGYPFRFKVSLLFGSIMYLFFSLGQSVTALGGIFMFVAAIFCAMLANMLTFGILANTAENFSKGDVGGDFMPRFDEFSLWDDVVHPFFLSIGAYLSAFGPFFVIAAIGTYMVFSSMASEQQAVMSEIEKLPGTPYYNTKNTADQTKEFNKILGDVNKQNDERLQQQADVANGSQRTTAASDPAEDVIKANELAQKNQQAQLESALGKTAETRDKEQSQFVARFLSLAAPLVVLSAIALLWGLFYFPAACAVAGYTRSFMAAINPLVGLDTIKRLGFDYVKLLFMSALVLIAAILIGSLLSMIFAPFNLPGMGNIPAKVVGSVFNFYFWIVFSCLIGLLLFKSSSKLKLHR